jgi:hypothetical protein
MDATTREESARPLGVIGSLAAGFEMLGQRLWLIALPVLLDLLLWLGPRLSIAPLLKQFVALLLAQPTADPTMALQVAQATQMLEQFGDQFNLFSLLTALPLLNVPSLLAQHVPGRVSPLDGPRVLLATNVLTPMAWGVVLVPMGLLLGFLYLNSLARQVRALRSPNENEEERVLSPAGSLSPSTDRRPEAEGSALPVPSGIEGSVVEGPALSVPSGVEGSVAERPILSSSLGKLLRVLLFAAGLLGVGMMLVPLWMLLVGVILATVPLLGLLLWSLGIGLGSYIALHLLFVVPGVLLGGRGLLRAAWESILLIHTQFSSVVALVLLVVVIYQGLGFVWSLPPGDSWALLIGILGNGCIATGLTAALFVFYQERIGQLQAMRQISAET